MFNAICPKCKIIYLGQKNTKTHCQCGIKLEPVLVPNFFEKSDVESIVDVEISDNVFEDFVNEIEDGMADVISEMVRQSWNDNE